MTAYRSMLDADRDFVISTWSGSFRTSRHAGMLAMETYAETMHLEIEAVLNRPSTQVTVAFEPDQNITAADGQQLPFLYGFIATREDLARPYVYYAYVKTAYRRGRERLSLSLGHGEGLLAAAGIDARAPFGFACRTSISDQLQRARKIPLAEWDPLPARFERPQ